MILEIKGSRLEACHWEEIKKNIEKKEEEEKEEEEEEEEEEEGKEENNIEIGNRKIKRGYN